MSDFFLIHLQSEKQSNSTKYYSTAKKCGAFVMGKRLFMTEPKTIYCPKCGRKVATWDGKSTINILVKCNKCKKLVVYEIDSEKAIIKDLPERSQSSGMRLY